MASKEFIRKVRRIIGKGKTNSERGHYWMETILPKDEIVLRLERLGWRHSGSTYPSGLSSYGILQCMDHNDIVISYM